MVLVTRRNGTVDLPDDTLPEQEAKLIRLENKYYKADVDVSFNDGIDSITEALIVISHDMEVLIMCFIVISILV